MTTTNDQHRQVELALQCSAFLDNVLDEHKDSDILPPTDAEKFKQAGFALNAAMNSLSTYYSRLGVDSLYLFNIVPKNHHLCHICLSASYLNPRSGLCYMGEDMMHQMRRLSAGCVRGNNTRNAEKKLVVWYSHGLSRLLGDNFGNL